MVLNEDMQLVEKILRRLRTLEMIIGRLFAVNPLPLVLLEKKVGQFEATIRGLPDFCSGLWVKEWKEKLAIYLDRLEKAAMPDEEETIHEVEEQLDDGVGQQEDIGNMTNSSVASSSELPHFAAAKVVPKSIDSQLRNAFSQLPRIANSVDIDNLKQLVALGGNSVKIITSESSTVSANIEQDIYRRMLRKLPMDLRAAFQQNRPPRMQTLYGILAYLRYHISNNQSGEYSRMKAAAALEADWIPSSEELKICNYCKEEGHIQKECTFVKRTLCFNCYQFSHTQKRCINESIFKN